MSERRFMRADGVGEEAEMKSTKKWKLVEEARFFILHLIKPGCMAFAWIKSQGSYAFKLVNAAQINCTMLQ